MQSITVAMDAFNGVNVTNGVHHARVMGGNVGESVQTLRETSMHMFDLLNKMQIPDAIFETMSLDFHMMCGNSPTPAW